MSIFALTNFADMAKLVDVPDLGSGAARRVGSSPIIRTKLLIIGKLFYFKIFTGLNTNKRLKIYFEPFVCVFCRNYCLNRESKSCANSGDEGRGASAFTIFPSGPTNINLGMPCIS